MRKTLENIIRIGSLVLALSGGIDLAIKREYGLNRTELAALAKGTSEQQEYAWRVVPGAAAYFGGAGAYAVALLSSRRRSDR